MKKHPHTGMALLLAVVLAALLACPLAALGAQTDVVVVRAGGTVTADATLRDILAVFDNCAKAEKKGDTWHITLTDDIQQSAQLRFEYGDFVLDLNGRRIYGMPLKPDGSASVAMVIKNYTNMTIKDSTGDQGSITNENGAAISLTGNVTLTIQGGTFQGGKAGENGFAAVQSAYDTSHLIVCGGKFYGGLSDRTDSAGYRIAAYGINAFSGGRVTLSVTGVATIYGMLNNAQAPGGVTVAPSQRWKEAGLSSAPSLDSTWKTLPQTFVNGLQSAPFLDAKMTFDKRIHIRYDMAFIVVVDDDNKFEDVIIVEPGIAVGAGSLDYSSDGFASFYIDAKGSDTFTDEIPPIAGDQKLMPYSYSVNGQPAVPLDPQVNLHSLSIPMSGLYAGENTLTVTYIVMEFVQTGDGQGVWTPLSPQKLVSKTITFTVTGGPERPAPVSPPTGDSTTPALWLALAVVSLGAVCVLRAKRGTAR